MGRPPSVRLFLLILQSSLTPTYRYNEARKVKEAQDAYCEKALAGRWEGLGDFPEELKWEQLVEVLRGRVKVQTHCYEATDFDGLIRVRSVTVVQQDMLTSGVLPSYRKNSSSPSRLSITPTKPTWYQIC